ncbi:hypothetical protein [Alteromonas sp. C1M14]|uniref:hypothetical protein n=1 Tax=Alteromonas sp. C1M14 TaxID=2841567 RepID=UPI001C0909CC|nr:hypothetical protein [Alteromonas sp. C1M14]MBU2977669.1 hypothetical protein [Alteromonas sp. C1M14]
MWRFIILMACILISAVCQSTTYTYTQSFTGTQYGKYQFDVMQAALDVTAKKYDKVSLKSHPFPMSQSRQIVTLLDGKADLMWSVTTEKLENTLLPVRFPLLQGLGGHRIFVINQAMQAHFPPNQTLDNIKRMACVQGADWPDTQILKDHHFTVHSATWSDWYTGMYRSLEEGMADYFPRNVIEVQRDLNYHLSEKLRIEKNHLLVYPSYEYLFVSPQRPELQARLYEGLTILLKNGELAKLFNHYPEHRKAKMMVNKDHRVVHHLSSSVLPYTWDNSNWEASPQAFLQEFYARNESWF